MSEIETPAESGALLVAHGVWVDSLIGGDDMEPADLLYVTYQNAWIASRDHERARQADDLARERQRSATKDAAIRLAIDALEKGMAFRMRTRGEEDESLSLQMALRALRPVLAAARDAAPEDSAR